MDRATIRGLARTWLNEASAGFWTDAELNTFINLANQKVNVTISNMVEDFFTQSATFPTVSGTKSYSLPTDFRFMRRLEHYNASDASDIIKLDEIRFPRTEAGGEWGFAASGKPEGYILRGSQIDLYPIPDAAYPLRIYYDYRKSDLTADGDIPSSLTDFHDMLVLWTVILALLKNNEGSDEFKTMYAFREKDLISTLQKRKGPENIEVEGYLEGVY